LHSSLQHKKSDNLVCAEKIGTCNYFWAFPSSAGQVRQLKLKELKEDIGKLKVCSLFLKKLCGIRLTRNADGKKDKKVTLDRDLEAAQKARPDTQIRKENLERLSFLKLRKKELEASLEGLKDRDPVTLDKKRVAAKSAKEAANRWTGILAFFSSFSFNFFFFEFSAQGTHSHDDR
jgi:hypothetical protein